MSEELFCNHVWYTMSIYNMFMSTERSPNSPASALGFVYAIVKNMWFE